MSNEVTNFYQNQNIFITGGTGFLGKILIQKLLRCCKGIKIYLLIREKKDIQPEKRLEKLFDDELFDLLKTEVPNFSSKIFLMEGDMSRDSLGLSEAAKGILIKNVNIVFHCAAKLNMSNQLKDSVIINVNGARELIKLCRSMKYLKSAVMVSTAYCQFQNMEIDEKFYECKYQADFIIKMCETLDDDIVETLKNKLIGNYINPYLFTKALTETMIASVSHEIPIALFRPTIITSTLSDPISGWTDNVFGALGVMFPVLMGLMRAAYFKTSTQANTVPVDYCANAVICTAWESTEKRKINKTEKIVYNYSNYPSNVTWGDFQNHFMAGYKYAFQNSIWAPFLIICKMRFQYTILNLLLHLIPAYCADCWLLLRGRRRVFAKIYHKVYLFHEVIACFNRAEHTIKNDNIKKMWEGMSADARTMFRLDSWNIDYKEYMRMLPTGLKMYFLKEKIDKVNDVKRLQRLKLIHCIVKCVLLWLLLMVVGFFVNSIRVPLDY